MNASRLDKRAVIRGVHAPGGAAVAAALARVPLEEVGVGSAAAAGAAGLASAAAGAELGHGHEVDLAVAAAPGEADVGAHLAGCLFFSLFLLEVVLFCLRDGVW